MPEPSPTDNVLDNVVQVEPVTEEDEMDIPANVSTMLISETAGNIQANNQSARAISTTAMGVLQGAMARRHDELGTVESRAHSGIIATPVASPTTQSGTGA